MSLKQAALLGVLFGSTAMFSGCGTGPVITSTSGTMEISGIVHGGQNPVSDSTIQLYTVGSGGLASAATPMLTKTVMSDSQGNFSITGDYVCGDSSNGGTISAGSNQVYVVATGGNPGLTPAVNNTALVLMGAIGTCSKLATTRFIEINEVTTVAAAWALAPFMTSYTQVGATSTNPDGIENAFLDAGLLADTSTGLAAAALPTNLTVETGKLYALADAVASCVNSNGSAGCMPLFTAATPSGKTKPADTLSAVLNIVKNPGQNVAAVYQAIGGTPPFRSSLTEAPNDWTMSLTVTGGGLASPTSLAIDKDSNIWVAGQDGPLSEFGPQGEVLSADGYGQGSIAQVYSVAVDAVGDVWVSNYNSGNGAGSGSVTEFAGSDAGTPGTILGQFSTPYASGLSADTSGDMFVANQDSSAGSEFSSSGALLYNQLGTSLGLNAIPNALAADGTGGFWLSDGDATIAHIGVPNSQNPNGQLLSHPTCGTAGVSSTYGLATDKDGTVWVADYSGGTGFGGAFAEVVTSAQGAVTVPISNSSVGGIYKPAFVVVDGAQNVWFSNYRGNTISEIAGNHTTVAGGTALSPTTGVYGTGGYGLDASILDPIGIAPDRAGNLWVSNEGSNTITMFFGLAAPTATPVLPVPTAP